MMTNMDEDNVNSDKAKVPVECFRSVLRDCLTADCLTA